ncbi:hypothetical protein PtA15_1A20 [Puccinia triticina]|uniref:Cation-transporting ATPase n=1 Tax=Puccinia triticina TaxID=208348 RepID=A0ABY7CCX9_9BASI|nr:uncharacterized protein PtA15_1A20 [Puccinia triticina]WAQ80682.1 hypothetical protein PtA15_1A20 [Puccinia triticina]WAR51573.1 hypothetical protein PtB15_1B9 [Puccinia triticina]
MSELAGKMDSTSARPSRHQDEATAGQDEDNVYGFQFDDRGDHPSSPEPSGADESQDLPIYDDPDGSMFSGPVAEVTPSSVTTMHLDSRFDSRSCRSTRSRRQGTSIRDSRPPSRRKPSIGSRSVRSRAPSKSNRSHRAQDDRKSEAGVSVASSRRRADLSKTRTQDHIPTTPTEEPESGFFNNLSAFLKGKGRSRSRDSRASSNRENYHYHTVNNKQRRQSQSRSIRSIKSSTWRSLKSNRSKARSAAANTSHESDDGWPDETDSLDRSSSASSNSTSTSNSDPSSSESSLLNRRTDGLNDHRIEVIPLTHPLPGIKSHSWHPSDIEMTKAQRLSTQSVYIIEDDLQVQFLGWRSVGWRVALWWLGSVMSAGVLWLVGRWKVAWRLKMGILEPFNQASHVVAYTEYGQPDIIDLQTLTFNQPVKLSTLCPPSLRVPPTTKDEPLISLSDNTGVSSSHPDPIGPVPQVAVNQRLSELYLTEIRYIDFRYHRFLLHPITQAFMRARDWQDPAWSTSVANLAAGLDQQESLHRAQLFGNNIIEVVGKSTSQLLMDEVLHPFYIFQIASIILWSADDYYYYAFCIALISVISVLSTLMDMKRTLARMRELSRFTCAIKVLRGSSWQSAESTELVPGDVIDVSETSLHTFPADLLLLSGDAIVNESMLTGESVPVSKFALPSSNLGLMTSLNGDPSPALAKHILFCGTNVIRVRKANQLARSKGSVSENAALAMVIRTGFSTTKGALVRSMLFPKPMDFAFYRDSFRFIGALALIASFGFIGSSINFLRMGIDWRTIMVRALDLITIVVPPALPATMSIGTTFAMSRLRKRNIFCISPNRVNIGGKINLVCFDKTGTLTEEGLDILGVRTVDRSDGNFSELYDEINNVPVIGAEDLKTPLVHALATCHGLKAVNGQIIGDPLDLRMFEFTGWSMEEAGDSLGPSNLPDQNQILLSSQPHKTPKMIERQAALVQTIVRPPGGSTFEVEDALKSTRFLELGIIRTFDFASELRRMSVLVKKLKSSTIEAYVKGAPEAMVEICMKETLPADYDEFLNFYTRHGYRVIAVAAKSFPKLSWIKAQRLTRSQVESELRFIGFVIFENKLKLGTEPAIQILKNAHIGVRMCTGDNIRTAISVGRDCGMIEESMRVYLPTFVSGSSSLADSSIAWFDIDNESALLDPYSLMPIPNENEGSDTRSMDSRATTVRSEDYVLAVSGDVFRWIMDYGSLETIERMLYKGVIFARMSPDEKHELVEQLQGLDYTVGFCGDGANDCGALKAADVGLSLSEAEASVAAPFTSRQPEITCFIELIREGRCALVTSFSCFKYMALYSLIQFTTITLLYSLPSSLGDFQFLYIDLFIIIPVAVTMGRTHPYGRIAAKRPTANLVSKRVLTSLLGQVLINSTIQLLVFLRVASQHEPIQVPANGEKLPTTNQENSALFLVSIFQYILVAATFSVGPPYRKPIFSNYLLVLCLLILGGFSLNLLFVDSGFLFNLLELVSLDYALRLELLLWIFFNIFSSWIFENYATQPIALWVGGQSKLLRKRWNMLFGLDGSSKRDRKRYKIIADNMDTP